MSGKAFGRDEMNALIGGSGAEEMAGLRASNDPTVMGLPQSKRQQNNPKQEVDFSKLSAAETAALLMEKGNQQQQGNVIASRYRAASSKKTLAHHELLAEELTKQERAEQLKESAKRRHEDSDDDDEEEQFVRKRQPTQASVVIRRKSEKDEDPSSHRNRRRYDSSSDDHGSDSEGRKRRRRRGGDGSSDEDRQRRRRADSSDSSSDDGDSRRRRLLAAQRARGEPEVVALKETTRTTEARLEKPKSIEPATGLAPLHDKSNSKKTKPSASSSSSSGSSSDSSSGTSGSDSSSDEEGPVITKAVFVPRHKRNLVRSKDTEWEEEEKKLALEKERKEKRKMESRTMLAKQLAEAESSVVEDEEDDEAGGATNAPPNDDDDLEPDKERNAWELRELDRLLKTMDEEIKRKREEEEYERRKNMTDAEVMEEDKKLGRYQAPGANRMNRDPDDNKHMQRFYHRGAYYMDESEWGEGDVRQKAVEYARAATGEDKIDKSKLPKVMQVKGFGKARQNHKYKGLAGEDTTDKSTRFLPIVQKQKHQK
jgi:microfibrillar-associated protein 1